MVDHPLNPATIYGTDAAGKLWPIQASAQGIQVTPGIQTALTVLSGVITLGGTSQLLQASVSRRYLFIQNPSTTAGQGVTAESLFFRFGATAAGVNNGTSIELTAGSTFTMETSTISTEAIQIIAATTNHKFIALSG